MWKLFDYVDERGRNDVKRWMKGLEKPDRARLEAKLDTLEEHGPGLPSDLLSDTTDRNLKKMRINGRVAPRPILCVGPSDNSQEYTLLIGAVERDRKWVPKNALKMARERREAILRDPETRRCPHGEEAELA